MFDVRKHAVGLDIFYGRGLCTFQIRLNWQFFAIEGEIAASGDEMSGVVGGVLFEEGRRFMGWLSFEVFLGEGMTLIGFIGMFNRLQEL